MLRFILFLLFFLGCAENQKTIAPKSDMDRLAQRKISYIIKAEELGERLYEHRCDRLTFNALLSAFGKKQDLSIFEYGGSGQYHRDVEPCYPHSSRSEISLDGLLMLTHNIVTHGDVDTLKRLYWYGQANDWIMGEGPKNYTNIYILAPILGKLMGNESMMVSSVSDILKGYRGHIAAMYIHLRGRVYGEISIVEKKFLESLVKASPNNPLYQAIYHKYHDGDQSKAISLLNEKYGDEFPTETSVYHWGSSPSSIYFISVVGILQDI